MKTPRFIVTLFALAFAFAPQFLRTTTADSKEAAYHAVLISPSAGQVLIPGQVVRIAWKSYFPNIDLSFCEAEIFLSLDGGQTFTNITGERDPQESWFDWVVPNTPTNAAVLDIRFGCLGYYPETHAIQAKNSFVISR